MDRVEEYKEADEPELSEPEWCWYSSCVENCVNECLGWALWRGRGFETKGARTWHLVNLPEQDAELVIFLWFNYNKTLTLSYILYPI